MIVVVTTRAYTLSEWSWYQDDLVFTTNTTQMSFREYVLQAYNGHVAPGTFALCWVFTALDPMNYVWPALVTCFFSGAAVVTWGLALREIFGERVHVLAVLVLVRPWPRSCSRRVSGGPQPCCTLPLEAFVGLCIWLMAEWLLRDRSRACPGRCRTLSFAASLLFWRKAVVVVTVPLFFLCLPARPGTAAQSDPPRREGDSGPRRWSRWVSLLVYLIPAVAGRQRLSSRGVGPALAGRHHQLLLARARRGPCCPRLSGGLLPRAVGPAGHLRHPGSRP